MLTAFIWKNKVLWLAMVLVVFVGLDQATKTWAQQTLTVEREVKKTQVVDGVEQQVIEKRHVAVRTIEVFPGVFNFKYAENPAAAFSLTTSLPQWLRRPFLLLVSSLASIAIAIWYMQLKQPDGLLGASFTFIIAGAVGNLLDRARFGYVIDFLDAYVSHPATADWLKGMFNTAHWPTFNVADMCIVVGAAGVIFRTFRPLPSSDESTDASGKPDAIVVGGTA